MKDPKSLWHLRVDASEWAASRELTAADASRAVTEQIKSTWETEERASVTGSVEVLADVRLREETRPPWLDVPSLGSNLVNALVTHGVVRERAQIRSYTVHSLFGAATDEIGIAVRSSDWRCRLRAMTSSDAVHGDEHFTEWERNVIDTAPMRRLKGIKQLGLADYVFHTALHTRFDHSLGTCAMAKRMMTSMEERGVYRFAPGEKDLVAMAALLHDISHIPFGHTLEDEHPVFRNQERHDHANRVRAFLEDEELQNVLGRYGWEEVTSILVADEEKPWEHHAPYQVQIVKNTVCADLLDYLRRDSLFCGLAQDYDDRLFGAFEIVRCQPEPATGVKPHLALRMGQGGQWRADIVAETLQLLRMREFLAERVYYNPKKIAYGAMLAKAVRTARMEAREFYQLQDHELLNRLTTDLLLPGETRTLAKAIATVKRYVRAYAIEHQSFPEVKQRKREEFLARHRDQENAREMDEDHIITELQQAGYNDIRNGDVVVYSPGTDMSLKEALVLGITPDDEVTTVHDMGFQEVTNLYDRYRDIWRFYVFVNKERFEDRSRVAKLRAICKDRLDALDTTSDVELLP